MKKWLLSGLLILSIVTPGICQNPKIDWSFSLEDYKVLASKKRGIFTVSTSSKTKYVKLTCDYIYYIPGSEETSLVFENASVAKDNTPIYLLVRLDLSRACFQVHGTRVFAHAGQVYAASQLPQCVSKNCWADDTNNILTEVSFEDRFLVYKFRRIRQCPNE